MMERTINSQRIELRTEQLKVLESVAARMRAAGACLLSVGTGFGKTVIACELLARGSVPATVVCPARVKEHWRNHLSLFGSPNVELISHAALSRGSSAALRAVGRDGWLIVDESHRFRNPRTHRFRNLAMAYRGQPLLFLSATPSVRHPADVLVPLSICSSAAASAVFGSGAGSIADDSRSLERSLEEIAAVVAPYRVANATSVPRLGVPTLHEVRFTPRAYELLECLLAQLEQVAVCEAYPSQLLRAALHDALHSSWAAFEQRFQTEALIRWRMASTNVSRETLTNWYTSAATTQETMLPALLGNDPTPSEALHRWQIRIDEQLHVLKQLTEPASAASLLVQKEAATRNTPALVFTRHVATVHWLRTNQRTTTPRVYLTGTRGWSSGIGTLRPDDYPAALRHARRVGASVYCTDCVSEGVDIDFARFVVHLEKPTTHANRAQRVGRLRAFPNVAIDEIVFTVDPVQHLPPDLQRPVPPAPSGLHLRNRNLLNRRQAAEVARAIVNKPLTPEQHSLYIAPLHRWTARDWLLSSRSDRRETGQAARQPRTRGAERAKRDSAH